MSRPRGYFEHEVTVRVKGLAGAYTFPPAEVAPPLSLRDLARRYVERHAERFPWAPDAPPALALIRADSFGGRVWFRFGASGLFEWAVSPPSSLLLPPAGPSGPRAA